MKNINIQDALVLVKKLYPVGTRIVSLYGYDDIVTDPGSPLIPTYRIDETLTTIYVMCTRGERAVYSEGNWAKIINPDGSVRYPEKEMKGITIDDDGPISDMPWSVDESIKALPGISPLVIRDINNCVVARVYGQTDEQVQANAQIIASTPLLREYTRSLLELVEAKEALHESTQVTKEYTKHNPKNQEQAFAFQFEDDIKRLNSMALLSDKKAYMAQLLTLKAHIASYEEITLNNQNNE